MLFPPLKKFSPENFGHMMDHSIKLGHNHDILIFLEGQYNKNLKHGNNLYFSKFFVIILFALPLLILQSF